MLRDRWLFGRRCRSFTLQWHLTNACGYNCAHCYDRSDRSAPPLPEARRILADLLSFCSRNRVRPHVCLSGGDPLAYPHFWELCAEISQAGAELSILGNPIAPPIISRLLQTAPIRSYQVSLEGLQPYNDLIRGPGHYERCLRFLRDARRLGLRTHVMLTLGAGNIDQVLPLSDELRGLTHRFTFNRLCQVGQGASLAAPTKEAFAAFLEDYLRHRRHNPLLGCKDNLFNILRDKAGQPLFSGCTGFGCGAAFNFLALLPDGQVHACRKLPSLIGSIANSSLSALYTSPLAQRYRAGPSACASCHLQKNCSGCMAVTYGHGLDPLKDCDPHCFIGSKMAPQRRPAAKTPLHSSAGA